jgi:ribosomal protein L11 methyltransferase
VRFVELAFTVPTASSEAWADLLVEIGAAGPPPKDGGAEGPLFGLEERDGTTLKQAPHGRVTLVAWLPPDEADAYLETVVQQATALPEAVIDRRDRDEDEWRDAWKKYFGILRVGTFVIVPSWERYSASDRELVIDLDPGRAFGTGGHASTRLCLQLIGEVPHGVRRALDVGCGSGVLAIAAARRWPEAHGLGTDIDPDAIEVSRENAERNRVAAQLTFTHEPLESVSGRFELVTANIQPEVLIPMAPRLDERLADGGSLVLSGILEEAAPPVVEAFQARGLRLVGHRDEGGWRALLFTRDAERSG